MSLNKLALIRYKTIDECLQNRYRNWTLEDLMEKVADAIYEYEGINTGISKRTIQGDIYIMRSDKLGYNAPIVVKDKKYYTYEDKNYSISKTIFSDKNIEKIKESLDILKQFEGFALFEGVSDAILKLETKITHAQQDTKSSPKRRKYIQFEANQQLKGLNFLTPLYKILQQHKPILLKYQSFKAISREKPPLEIILYPYLLKEYRNRWFLVGLEKNHESLSIFALDRIVNFEVLAEENFVDTDVNFDEYFSDLVGVTKSTNQATHKVVLQIDAQNAPYVLTKPIHPSQKLLEDLGESIIISLEVVMNFELEREILGFGQTAKVLSPPVLVTHIKKRLKKANLLYEI